MVSQRSKVVRADRTLTLCFVASGVIHVVAITMAWILVARPSFRSQRDVIPINLVDVASPEEKKVAVLPKPQPLPAQRAEAKPPAPIPQLLQREIPNSGDLQSRKDEPERAPAPSSSPGGGGDSQSSVSGTSGKGSGAGDLSGSGDLALAPGGGAGKSGAGRGEGPAGPGTGERGFREARPLQTAKASYPPMALRMGLEADVTLKVFVDMEGRVTKAEILKSAGMGFDEEALKAVKQFRFEPARKDSRNVPAELTYIYRFRLQK